MRGQRETATIILVFISLLLASIFAHVSPSHEHLKTIAEVVTKEDGLFNSKTVRLDDDVVARLSNPATLRRTNIRGSVKRDIPTSRMLPQGLQCEDKCNGDMNCVSCLENLVDPNGPHLSSLSTPKTYSCGLEAYACQEVRNQFSNLLDISENIPQCTRSDAERDMLLCVAENRVLPQHSQLCGVRGGGIDCKEYMGNWTTNLNRFLSIPGASIYSDFVAMLVWTGVLDMLNNGGDNTLFLPSNDGFSKKDECFSLVALGLAKGEDLGGTCLMLEDEVLEYARDKVLYHIADTAIFGNMLGHEEQLLQTSRRDIGVHNATTLIASTTGIRDYRMQNGKEAKFLQKNILSIYTEGQNGVYASPNNIGPAMGIVHTINRTLDYIPLVSIQQDDHNHHNSGRSVKSGPCTTLVKVLLLIVSFTVFFIHRFL